MGVIYFFFFRQKTAYEVVDCDWSSDVCSSDLIEQNCGNAVVGHARNHGAPAHDAAQIGHCRTDPIAAVAIAGLTRTSACDAIAIGAPVGTDRKSVV